MFYENLAGFTVLWVSDFTDGTAELAARRKKTRANVSSRYN